jgi:hypothetical protein
MSFASGNRVGDGGVGGLGDEYSPPYGPDGALASYKEHSGQKKITGLVEGAGVLVGGRRLRRGDAALHRLAMLEHKGAAMRPRRRRAAGGIAVRRRAARVLGRGCCECMSPMEIGYGGLDLPLGPRALAQMGMLRSPPRGRGMGPIRRRLVARRHALGMGGARPRRHVRGGASGWINFVKQYQKDHGVSYKDALQLAGPEWRIMHGR